jgi:hypothetical protein
VSAKLGCPWHEYDFSMVDRRRQDYQYRFTKALWRRDYIALRTLHQKYQVRSNAIEGGSVWRWKVQIYDNIFGEPDSKTD